MEISVRIFVMLIELAFKRIASTWLDIVVELSTAFISSFSTMNQTTS